MRNSRSTFYTFSLIAIAVLLASCSDGKLTEEQCLTINAKEITQISSWSSATHDPRWVNESTRRNVAACVAGDRYTREDYKCFISASTNEEIGRCMCLESAGNASDKEREQCNDRSKP